MPRMRIDLVNKAFQKLDKNGDGISNILFNIHHLYFPDNLRL